MKIVCECKRAVGLATVEEFIGKLHDLNVGRGVLCVFGSITAPGVLTPCSRRLSPG
ncbi:hypothetical protein ACFYRN_41910 [Streptomyces sp. NPDC005227]|uniref:hypothetical protein n=1 Tax=Streptomyces sp. NPDC005227 TaxID=3364707 RepID=UPI0036A91744